MKKLLVIFTAILIFSFIPGVVQALGVAVGPTNIEINDALRGGEYKRTITIFNPSSDDTEYTITAEGEAANWTSFFYLNPEKPIENKISISGKSNVPVLVKIKVPDDITNDTYNAKIIVQTVPPEGLEGTGVATIMQATSTLTINVKGEQIRDGEVIRISVVDTEVGIPARIETLFKNTGNVIVKPEINCVILKETQELAEISYADTEVGVENQDTITVEWNTDNQREGEYTARVSVFLDDRLLTTKDIPFELFPPGTLTKEGEFVSFYYEGQPALNSLLKIEGIFSNTGQVASYASLVAEIYRDDALFDTVESEKTLAPVGQKVGTSVYYTFEEVGNYTIKGLISYDGKRTDTKEIELAIGTETNLENSNSSGNTNNDNENGNAVSNTSNSFLTIGLPIIIVVLVILGVSLMYFLKKNKRTNKSDSST
jgi:hypothetical protein